MREAHCEFDSKRVSRRKKGVSVLSSCAYGTSSLDNWYDCRVVQQEQGNNFKCLACCTIPSELALFIFTPCLCQG